MKLFSERIFKCASCRNFGSWYKSCAGKTVFFNFSSKFLDYLRSLLSVTYRSEITFLFSYCFITLGNSKFIRYFYTNDLIWVLRSRKRWIRIIFVPQSELQTPFNWVDEQLVTHSWYAIFVKELSSYSRGYLSVWLFFTCTVKPTTLRSLRHWLSKIQSTSSYAFKSWTPLQSSSTSECRFPWKLNILSVSDLF